MSTVGLMLFYRQNLYLILKENCWTALRLKLKRIKRIGFKIKLTLLTAYRIGDNQVILEKVESTYGPKLILVY